MNLQIIYVGRSVRLVFKDVLHGEGKHWLESNTLTKHLKVDTFKSIDFFCGLKYPKSR
jgi:hypothetical protein